MAVLDRATELAQRRQRESSSGQHGLFLGGSGPSPEPRLALPDVPEWSEAERLAGEKEVLGFYVTGHPLVKYLPRLAGLTRHDSSTVDQVENETPVTLGGILTGLRVRPSRKGDLWASGYLEDLRGSVELLVFPQALQQYQSVLKSDAAVLIKGRVRHEENARPKVVVSEVTKMEAAVNGAKEEVLIRLNLAETEEKTVEELEQLLAAHPGENPVVFELTKAGDFLARLRPRRLSAIKADPEVVERLRELCGQDAVSIKERTVEKR